MRIFKTPCFAACIFALLVSSACLAQENISVTNPVIDPTPLATVENNGFGCLSFNIVNVSLPGYDSAGTEILVDLSKIAPRNGIESLTSSLGDLTKYEWQYDVDSNVFRGMQISPIGLLYSEEISVCFKVIENSVCDSLESNGFGVEAFVVLGTDGNTNDNFVSTFTCTDEEISSIDESKVLDPNIKIYPNPTSNWIQIDTQYEIDRVELYDLLGKRVLNEKYDGKAVHFDNLNEGIYIMRVLSKENEIIGLKELSIINI